MLNGVLGLYCLWREYCIAFRAVSFGCRNWSLVLGVKIKGGEAVGGNGEGLGVVLEEVIGGEGVLQRACQGKLIASKGVVKVWKV